jgi:hypothetical protein
MENRALTHRSMNEMALRPIANFTIGFVAGSGSTALVEKAASRAIMTPAV